MVLRFFVRAIRSSPRSLIRIRQEDATTRAVEKARHCRCHDCRSADRAIATGNPVEVGGIDDPQPATFRLLMDCNLAHALADTHLAGRNRHRHALADQPPPTE